MDYIIMEYDIITDKIIRYILFIKKLPVEQSTCNNKIIVFFSENVWKL